MLPDLHLALLLRDVIELAPHLGHVGCHRIVTCLEELLLPVDVDRDLSELLLIRVVEFDEFTVLIAIVVQNFLAVG